MEEAVKLLKKYNQEKVLKELEKNKNPELIEQILNMDFDKIEECKQKIGKEEQFENDKIEKISYIDGNKLTKEERDYYENIGKDIISKGKYAIVTMAGGQGTRLGHIGPKGTFKIDVKPNPKYLFEILTETLKKANEKYNVTIPWYIMVSRENKEETIAFLEEKNYFNYPKEMIKFFVQGEMPLIGEDGQFLLNKEGSLMLASDGNGSIYYSMKKNGILEDMKQKQIEWVYICSVDNVLLQMVEPILLGLTIEQKNEIASKTIVKNGPEERVGVFCKKNGKPSVIEYTELPKDMAELRDEEGELIFGEAHIMCNLFSINAIEKIAEKTLLYHIAFKKINHYIDGKLVEPEEPNSYKFEQFIFDSFPFFENITLLRGKREEDFAPVKNKEGNDSPKTAAELYNNYWRNF